MRRIFYPIIFTLSFLYCAVSLAKEAPDDLLKRVTHELISELREQDKDTRQNNQTIYVIIDKVLVPHVDWHAMSQWVVGRQAWEKATPKQKERFSSEFKDLLIRTYASTLKAYNNQTIEYMPIRGGLDGKTRVQVASRIREPGREPIKVTYRLIDKGDNWQVYDISIEGISLLKGFQSQFAEDIQHRGIDALTLRLHQHNEKPLRCARD